jgi:hypothetical protein
MLPPSRKDGPANLRQPGIVAEVARQYLRFQGRDKYLEEFSKFS